MSERAHIGVRRVLLVHDYAGARGGAEVVMQDMRAALRKRGVDARLMASTADPADQAAAADYSFVGSTGRLRALRETFNPDAARVARKVMRTFNPQVVHVGMLLTQASPAVLPAFKGRAVVWAPNEYRAICPRGSRLLPNGPPCSQPPGLACLRNGCFRPHGLAPRLVQLALFERWRHAVDLVVGPSQAFADELERHGITVDTVVPNGVRPPLLAAQPASSPALLGFAGRLVPEKGTHVLLDALALLPRGLDHVRLVIAGDGPERRGLEARVRVLGLSGRVYFLGHVSRDDVDRHLATATVQVVPSLWAEPFGLTAVEAMARGTPVMVSAAGALAELVEDGRTGFLVPPGDAPALAQRLVEVLADPDERLRVSREARRIALQTYDIDRVVDRFLELYAALISRPVAVA